MQEVDELLLSPSLIPLTKITYDGTALSEKNL